MFMFQNWQRQRRTVQSSPRKKERGQGREKKDKIEEEIIFIMDLQSVLLSQSYSNFIYVYTCMFLK